MSRPVEPLQPIRPTSDGRFGALGDRLRALGYDRDPRADPSTPPDPPPPGESPPPGDVLIALLRQGASAPLSEVVEVLGAESVDALVESGLADRQDDHLACNVRVVAWKGLLVVGDPGTHHELRPESVPAVSGTTRVLDALRMERPVGHAVDVGCGSGALALRLAGTADRVTATDVNPRAISLTRVNAALNRLTNIDAVEGPLLEPLGAERADLVLANLPFVLSPDRDYLFRDGDRDSDRLVADAVTGAASRLTTGGVAHLLVNWEVRDADPAHAPRELTEGSGCDVIAIDFASRPPADHARHWNRDLETVDPAAFAAVAERWTDWLVARGTDAVVFGALVLRRPSGRRPRFSFFDASGSPAGRGGRQIERILAAMDDPAAVERGSAVPTLPPHHLLQSLTHDGVAYEADPAEFVADDSAGVSGTLSPEAAAVAFAVDGTATVEEIISGSGAARAGLEELWRRGLLELDADPRSRPPG